MHHIILVEINDSFEVLNSRGKINYLKLFIFLMILNVMNQLDICNVVEWLLKVLEYGPMTVITSLEKVFR